VPVRSTFRKVAARGPDDVAHSRWTDAAVEIYTSDVNDDDFQQARDLWKIYEKQGIQDKFIGNLCSHLKKALPEVQKETISELQLLSDQHQRLIHSL
jgi:catalase